MKLPRRAFLHLAPSAAALTAVSRYAWALDYPKRPVRIIVGLAPGGTADILARLIGKWLSDRLGQPFIVENRPGAATNIATEMVAKAPPDGYTLLLYSSSTLINATLYQKLDFNLTRDITPVVSIARGPYVIVLNPSLPVTSVPELIAYAKANPGKISMATAGRGSATDVAGAMFQVMTGVRMTAVPYQGDAPALVDLMAGRVQVYFSTLSGSIELIRAGKLRALAVTTKTRSNTLPDLPTVADSVPGYEATLWNGLAAPSGTPHEIIETLNQEVNAALNDLKIKARLADLGSAPAPLSIAACRDIFAEEIEKWGKVIRMANIKPE